MENLLPPMERLAVLLDSLDVEGTIEAVDTSLPDVSGVVKNSFKGLKLASYRIESRDGKSSVFDLLHQE